MMQGNFLSFSSNKAWHKSGMGDPVVILLKFCKKSLTLNDMHIIVLLAQCPEAVRHSIHGEQIILVLVKRSLLRGCLIDLFPELTGQSFP